MGDGKSNPFGNGKSGADGNSGGGSSQGMSNHRGPDLKQKSGSSIAGSFDGDHPEKGDKYLKIDPPSDREGLVGQTVKGLKNGKPFKLGGKGPSMPSENADEKDGGPVGDVDVPQSDSDF
jgi:hypothetical protein